MRNLAIVAAGMLTALAIGTPGLAERMAAPADAAVTIISPEDGATISGPVTVLFGLDGMGVAPAGVEAENTGHHHLLINIGTDAIDLENPLPADDNVRHFGGGQTQTTVELEPGEYTLQLLLGDHNHIPHDPAIVSEVITVTVE